VGFLGGFGAEKGRGGHQKEKKAEGDFDSHDRKWYGKGRKGKTIGKENATSLQKEKVWTKVGWGKRYHQHR